MIVKNEAPVIRRCLESVRPIIDHWVIVDTGSSDATQEIIRDYLKDLPGELHERPWRDFAHNRSEALTLARPHGDYSLIIDADDALEIPEDFRLSGLTADSYALDIHDTAIHWQRTQIVRNTLPWRYQGVLHECLTCEGARSAGHLPMVMRRGYDGARRRDPERYRKDAAILESALLTETDPLLRSRYTFYLAQSYRDCGEPEKALKAYLERAELGFWTEEIFESLSSAGNLMERLGHRDSEIIGTYLKAYGYSPNRVESLQALVNYCHRTGKASLGHLVGKQAITKPMPSTGLFLKPFVYDYAMLDDFAVAAYWASEFEDCLDACETLLSSGKLPSQQRARVEANARFAKSNLANRPDSGATVAVGRAEGDSGRVSAGLPCVAEPNPCCSMTVFIVKPPNYVHWEAYRELSETVFYGLQALGYETTMTSDVLAVKGRSIIIGAHVAQSELVASFSEDAIIYNTEHVAWIEGAGEFYTSLLRRHEVWDYSQDNAKRLAEILGKGVRFVKIGYVQELTRIAPNTDQDIDVLFIGSWKERRQAILDQLQQAGVRVHRAFGLYGEARDDLVARSKIVLNMHHYQPGAFEIVRVSYMLANRKVVVTEANPGEVIDDDLTGALVAVPYDKLVDAILKLLRSEHRCTELQEAGFRAFTARNEASILEEVLGRRATRTAQPTNVSAMSGEVDAVEFSDLPTPHRTSQEMIRARRTA
jgi:glycosyltransferase involved in cell wall biosynthesis